MEIQPDTILNNRYQIKHHLGKGGMGAVYLAVDTALEHDVAIKTNLQTGEHGSSQFLREARLLARLRHPNLPRVIDYFLYENQQCLVMDYIPGSDLRDLLEKQGPAPLQTVLTWANQLGFALSYLHNQNPPVIHRDIKPANIKLTLDHDVILVDFGIAKASETTQATATGAYGYTPGFAPPEQYGAGRTGPYSDQFSLAATLYALLTNHTPADAVQRALGEAVLTPLTAIRPDVPKYIQDTLEKALSVNLEERYTSIDDFLNSLNRRVMQQPGATIANRKQAVHHKNPAARWIWLILILGIMFIVFIFGGLLVARKIFFPAAAQVAAPTKMALQSISTVNSTPILNETSVFPTRTAGLPSPAAILQPSLTPILPTLEPANFLGNGKMIAFISDRADGKIGQIWTMKVKMFDNAIKASDLIQRTFDNTPKQDPSWSPDGKWILYSAPGPGANGLDIWKLDVSNPDSQPIRLIDMKWNDFQPTFSPNGSKIAFTHYDGDNGVNRIYFMNQDGSEVKAVTVDFNESQPLWSPDGKWLLFVINASNHHYFYMYNLLDRQKRIAPTPYPTPQPFDNKELFGRLGDVTDPSWAINGDVLAYTRTEGLTRRIYRVDFSTRGAGAVLLTQGTFKESDPTWAPDADWICFTSERDNNPEIYIMTSVGQLATNLSLSPGIDRQPAWQP